MQTKKRDKPTKIALVYDQVNKFGGAERLLLALHKIYPSAPLYTLVHNPATSKWASVFKVIPSPINIFKFLRPHHQWLAPIAPMMFETFNFDDFDIVISITSGNAKAIITKPETLHICYCLTPTRYLWGETKDYDKDIKMRFLPKILKKYFRNIDLFISKRPDQYIAISKEVKTRIKDFYQQKSVVIYPPIANNFYSKIKPPKFAKRKYYLVVGRHEPYKKIDIVISAFSRLPKLNLKVVGEGSESKRLKQLAGDNVDFLGQVSDKQLLKLYRNAKALIFPQNEDFGLVPLEAQASGTPVLAFHKGGAKETVIDKETGLFFNKQTPSAIIEIITRFEGGNHHITAQKCRLNASYFTQTRFIKEFRGKVNGLWQGHKKILGI